MANGIPSLSPKEFYADARDAAVNGLDLIEEFSEVTFESTDRVIESKDPLLVETVSFNLNQKAAVIRLHILAILELFANQQQELFIHQPLSFLQRHGEEPLTFVLQNSSFVRNDV